MHLNFQRLLKVASKSILPVLSITLLNMCQKKIFNSVDANTQIAQSNDSGAISSSNPTEQHEQQSICGNWNWDRIIQINSPQQLTRQQILQKNIICYQMTGDPDIDSQVAIISHQFCDKYFGKINSKFQFVFLSPNPNFPIEQQLLYVIFNQQATKYVPIKKYLNLPALSKRPFISSYSPLFTRLHDQINKYHQLSLHNINQHLQHLNTQGRDTYQLVIVPENDSQEKILQAKIRMERYLKNREIWNSQIVKAVVVDNQTRGILGLVKQNGVEINRVYLISTKNQNLLHEPKSTFKIQSKSYTVIPAQNIQKQFVFPPIPPKLSSQSYILKFNIDLNQTRPQAISDVYDVMRNQQLWEDLGGEWLPKLLTFSKNDQSIEITIQKNNHDSIIHAYEPDCMYEESYKKDLLAKSNVWKYPHNTLDPQKLRQFVHIVKNKNKIPKNQQLKQQLQYFRSEPETQSVRKYSKLIVGEERKQIINKNQDKIIFHFSKSCHSCKRFGGVYQDIARELKNVNFYRIDNDTNKTEGLKNYNSTPVFVMYKNGYNSLPWHYKMPYFTKTLFTSFVQITRQVGVLNSTAWENHMKQHIQSEALVKQTLKQFI